MIGATCQLNHTRRTQTMPTIPKKTTTTGANGAAGTAGAPGYRLHKEHAVLHAASIDVKILRLDKRQLTLSVARQLREKSIFLFDDLDSFVDGLRGTPWGTINYVWDKCPAWAGYQLLWQEGDLLYRMPLPWVADLFESFPGDKARVLYCPKCDEALWLCYGPRCPICKGPVRWVTRPVTDTYYEGLLSYITGRRLDWPERRELRLRGESDRDRLPVRDAIEKHLAAFEKLDQLFIAV
jgi:hypothetical protein